MYWPVGAPRIYAAKVPPPPTTLDYDSEDSGELVRNSLSLSSSGEEGNQSDSVKGSTSDEDESQKVGEQEVEEDGSVIDEVPSVKGNEGSTNGATTISDETRTHLVAVEVARSGALFATITTTELTIWQTKPTAVVAHVRRSLSSIESYGLNMDVLIRPDSQIFVVQTALGYLMTYSLATDPNGRVYKPQFVRNGMGHSRQHSVTGSVPRMPMGPHGLSLGAGEGGGVREFSLQFRMVIKVDAGISKVLALENELMVATIKPSAIQCIRWTPDSTGSQTSAELLSRMSWMQKKVIATDMVYDRPMNLSTWITDDGRAYAVQKHSVSDEGSRSFKGYCFHIPSTTEEAAVKVCINARFSMIAVGCSNGCIYVYNARDYNGNIPLSHKLSAPVSSPGRITFITWSPDGYCLMTGYSEGWATWSVYGKPGGSSFYGTQSVLEKPNEQYLGGVKGGAWLANGGQVLLLKNGGDERIWSLEFAKSATTGCFSCVNTTRPLLQNGEKLFIYRGYGKDDITMISQDTSVLWNTVQIPAAYLADNWPIRSTVTSPDGRYVAIAGTRGLAHYSVNSGRWKMFLNEQMEQEFMVRGGMCWYQHILIAAIESGESYELRLYSRELQLDNSLIVHREQLQSPVVFISLTGDDSLLVYTHDNTLYHFIIQSTENSIKLVQVGRIGFHGIIHAPTRVRSISWIVPDDQLRDGDPSRDVATATVLFLLDGKLVLLQPSYSDDGGLKYDMRVILQNVEYYSLVRDQPMQNIFLPKDEFAQTPQTPLDGDFPEVLPTEACALSDSLWAFDGNDVKVWMDVKQVLEASLDGRDLPQPVKIPVDFYPMSTLLTKGIILGIESDLVQRRDISISYFKFSTRTHLFLTHLLRHLLTKHQPEAAVLLARNYSHLTYFPHALEVLLHDVLDDEADHPPHPSAAILPEVVSFLSHFPPHYLDVIVQCTRKTEVASWRHLFNVVGSPQALFEESLTRGLLKTAGSYLLVLHTLEQLSESSQDMVRLFSRAVAEGDWDLCKELARFLTSLDNSGKTLREALELVQLRSPVVEDGRSFMFSGAETKDSGTGGSGDYGFPEAGK